MFRLAFPYTTVYPVLGDLDFFPNEGGRGATKGFKGADVGYKMGFKRIKEPGKIKGQ